MRNTEFEAGEAVKQAAVLFQIITSESDPVMDFRLIPEKAELKAAGATELKRRGRLSQLAPALKRCNDQGYAVFYVASRTDGVGAKLANMMAVRCLTLDLDGAPLPDEWTVPPHFIQETSPGKWQVTWAIQESRDFDVYTDIMKRLAAFYGGDLTVCDVPRVFRSPGFLHQKHEPFRSRIVEHMELEEVQFDRRTFADFNWLPPVQLPANGDSAPSDGRVDDGVAKLILQHLEPTDFASEATWLPLAMSFHDASDGSETVRDLLLEWSRNDGKYDTDEIEAANRARWESFDGRKGKRYTIATLVKILQDHDAPASLIGKLTHTSAAEDFDDGLEFLLPEDDGSEFESSGQPEQEWPHAVPYRNDRNSRQNAARFLRHRPGKIISSDRILYSLDGSSGIWKANSDDEMSAEIAKTDERRALSHNQIEGVRDALHMDTHTPAVPFTWLDAPADAPDANDTIIFRNGLLNFKTGVLIPHTGAFFATATPAFDYDPDARCPRFMAFLDEVLAPSYHPTLQEFMGYVLTADTQYQKMLALIGVSRGGKGTTLRLIEKLVGVNHCAAASMHDLGAEFGLQGTEDKRVIMIPDAKDMRGGHGRALERILQIVGCDAVPINRKHNTYLRRALAAKMILAANKVIKMLDDASALAARTLLLKFETSFLGREDTNLDTKLAGELPGIANWALDGLKRLRENGAFTVGAEGKAAVRQMALGQSPSLRFASDRLVVTGDKDDFMRLKPLFAEYRSWAAEDEQLNASEIRGRNDFLTDFTAALAAQGVRYEEAGKYRDPDTGARKTRRGLIGIRWK